MILDQQSCNLIWRVPRPNGGSDDLGRIHCTIMDEPTAIVPAEGPLFTFRRAGAPWVRSVRATLTPMGTPLATLPDVTIVLRS